MSLCKTQLLRKRLHTRLHNVCKAIYNVWIVAIMNFILYASGLGRRLAISFIIAFSRNVSRLVSRLLILDVSLNLAAFDDCGRQRRDIREEACLR